MRRVIAALRVIAVLLAAALCTGLPGCGDDPPKPSRDLDATVSGADRARVVAAFNRGVGLMARYEPGPASEAFQEAVDLAPRWITARVNLGIALLNADRPELNARADAELRRVLREDPEHAVAHYALAMLLKHLGRYDEARTLLQRVLALDPGDVDTHYQLGELLSDDDPAAARRHLEDVVARAPHHAGALYRLFGLAQARGDAEAARRWLARFQALDSAGAGDVPGMKYGEMGRLAAIVRPFRTPPATAPAGAAPAYVRDEPLAAGADAPATGLALEDADGDGDLDLLLPGRGLWANDGGALAPAGEGAIPADPGARAAAFGDTDKDGDADCVVVGADGVRLWRNEGGGRFRDATDAAGLAGAGAGGTGGAPHAAVHLADADHDGDVDLLVLGGDRGVLWRNDGDGTFTDVTADLAEGLARARAACFLDVDADGDADLIVLREGEGGRVLRNDRVGRWTDVTRAVPALAGTAADRGILRGDVDGDGREDVIFVAGGGAASSAGPLRLVRQPGPGRFAPPAPLAETAGADAAGALLGDLDLDGDLDLVLVDAAEAGTRRHVVLAGDGRGRFVRAGVLDVPADAPPAIAALAADLDDDGMLEVLVARRGGALERWKAPPPEGRHWLVVVPVEADALGEVRAAANPFGLGVEVQTGRRMQRRTVASAAGLRAGAPARVHFGLGGAGTADYARLTWPGGVLQSEMEVAGDRAWRVRKVERKPSSCPLLFAWDGERFAFVTDFLGVGGVGFFVAPGVYAPPDPTEAVRIPPVLVRPKDGRWLLRIAEPLEEVTWLDRVQLLVHDHPEGWEVHPDERFASQAPWPTGTPRAVAERILPVAARDHAGRDALARLAAVDRRYVEPPVDPRFKGYARDHALELDFGDRVRALPAKATLVLFLHGWVEYTYSHVNYAAWQAGIAMQAPRIEVPDGQGGWRVALEDAGFPAGLPRMMTVDVSALPLREDGRLRLRTNMEVFWDQAFLAVDRAGPEIVTHVLDPDVARLRHLGYPREYSPDGRWPTLYDYDRIDPALPFRNMAGAYTRFGDVRELLAATDDRFVVFGRGEEIELEFDAGALPALRPGRARTLVLDTDGYCKDMDLYTAAPDTVGPQPFHAMGNYPPERPHPDTEGQARYVGRWNTRRIPAR